MNRRKIWFSGIITSAIGVGIGLVLAKIVDLPYTSQAYDDQRIERIYMMIGGMGGLVIGTTQEALRQLLEERDQLESEQESKSQSDK